MEQTPRHTRHIPKMVCPKGEMGDLKTLSADEIWGYVLEVLSEERLIHTKGTVEEVSVLAPHFGVDPDKASLAAMLHDIARDLSPQELLQAAESRGIMVRTVDRLCPVLLHGRIAAAKARELGVSNEDVLQAIASHVTGRPGWTSLEQALYLADKTEPGRDYPGVARVRELSRSGRVREALKEALRNSIIYALESEPGFVDPETVVVFNEVAQGLSEAPDRPSGRQ